jgi:predicted nuclease of predicted toxin-antitoxin system
MLTNQFKILKLRFVNVQTERLKILKRYFEVVVQKIDKYNSRKKSSKRQRIVIKTLQVQSK